jgi:hypothetical protein
VPKNDKDININKGIELMLRRAKEDQAPEPMRGFGFKQSFSLLKRKVEFNLELRWGRQ